MVIASVLRPNVGNGGPPLTKYSAKFNKSYAHVAKSTYTKPSRVKAHPVSYANASLVVVCNLKVVENMDF